jgi:uncharacterized protein (TIGR01244 family)
MSGAWRAMSMVTRTRRPMALVAAALAFVLPATAGEIPASMPASEIPGYLLVSPSLAIAAQPAPQALARLKELGFKTVVNIRAANEPGVPEEAEVVRAQGLEYHLIPVTPATFSAEHVDAIAKILEAPSAAPVLFHCSSSNRVGAVFAVLEARKGRSCAEAEEVGRRYGLKSPQMAEAARRVGNCR